MRKTTIILYICIVLWGCSLKSDIEGTWEFRWQSENILNQTREDPVPVKAVQGFSYLYYLTGNREIGDSGIILVEGIQMGEYKINGTSISLDLNDNYQKMIGVEIREYVGQVIDDQYMAGEVSFKYNGQEYTISWDAEKL